MKVLIANRGEIAVRVIRACRELGFSSVAVYSDCDRGALHVRLADQAVRIGGDSAAESYLNIDSLIAAARRVGATAIHPGYGFLAENATFAEAAEQAGLVFVGPASEVIALMGSKTAARDAAKRAGIPAVPGTVDPIASDVTDDTVGRIADDIGYPLLIKAVAGGGGKGMRTVTRLEELPGALRAARSEARSAFGNDAVYLERRLERPRHVEIQLLGDHHGTLVAFVERECSIQRRHQKLLEESPCVVVSTALREKLAAAAIAIGRQVGYTNAGTIEFLLDSEDRFYFLEVNTRLQVEHPITEYVCDIDLVRWQLDIARGRRLVVDPVKALQPRGHAIECRIYAEDPQRQFLPDPGLIEWVRPPGGPGIRDDSGIEAGSNVPVFYDSLLSKLIAWAESRSDAIARMQRAVDEYDLTGVKTTLPLFRWLLHNPDFRAARYDTTFLERALASGSFPGEPSTDAWGIPYDEVAAIGVALQVMSRDPSALQDVREQVGGWKAAARAEGLREWPRG